MGDDEADGVAVGVAELLAVGDGVAESDPLELGVVDAVRDIDGVAEGEAPIERDDVGVTLGAADVLSLTVVEDVGVCVDEDVGVAVDVALEDDDGVSEGEREIVDVGDMLVPKLCVVDDVADDVGERDVIVEGDGLGDEEADGVAVGVAELLASGVGVSESDPVKLSGMMGVIDDDGDDGDCEGVTDRVGSGELDDVGLSDGVAEALFVPELLGVRLRDAPVESDDVGVGLCDAL